MPCHPTAYALCGLSADYNGHFFRDTLPHFLRPQDTRVVSSNILCPFPDPLPQPSCLRPLGTHELRPSRTGGDPASGTHHGEKAQTVWTPQPWPVAGSCSSASFPLVSGLLHFTVTGLDFQFPGDNTHLWLMQGCPGLC